MVSTYNGSAVPGQKNEPQSAGQATIPVQTAKRLALIGAFPWLAPATVTEVSSEAAFAELSPGTDLCGRLARWVFQPAKNDPKVTRQPAGVLLVNALGSARATATLTKSGTAVVVASCREYGGAGNRGRLTVASGTLSGKKYTIAMPGRATEIRDNVTFGDVGTFNYTGSFFTTCAMAFDTTNGLRISYTKTLIAVGTTSLTGMIVDGTITLTPSVGPGVGETFTATITGTNKVTNTSGTAVFTWDNAAGTAGRTSGGTGTTGIAQFSGAVSIEITVTAGTPTFTASGYAFDLPPVATGSSAAYTSAKSLIDRVDAATDFEASAGTPAAAAIPTTKLDAFSSSTIKAAAKSLTADLYAMTEKLGNSAIVVLTRQSGATGAPDNGTYTLAGGADGSATSDTWQAALDALDEERVNVAWMDTDDAAIHALGAAKMDTRLAAGGKACILHLGATASEDLATLDARVLGLNRYTTVLWNQSISRYDQFGILWEDLAPKYHALTWAAIQTMVAPGEPLTRCQPNIVSYSQPAALNPATQADTLIQHHISFVGKLGGVIVGIRPMTAYGVGDNIYYDEPGCVDSFLMSTNDVHDGVTAVKAVGAADVVFTEASYRQLVQERLNQQLQPSSRLIRGWDPASLRIVDVPGGPLVAYWNEQPIAGRNWIVTRPTAVPVQTAL